MSNPPKPTRLKLLAGTARKDRISPCEPDPGELDLTPPAELSPAAVEHWHRFATMLARSGVAKASDRELLAMLAEGYARHCANVQAGKLDLGLMKELRLMLGQFGMSPATRSRIVADKPQGDGKASRYFGVPRKGRKRPQDAAGAPAGYFYDKKAAERAVSFFADCLIHTKGEWAGQPLALSKWQADGIIRPLFGWKRPDGTRRYRTVFVMIPRKAGKSTLSAGIGLYLLFADGEPGAEIYSAAADRDQANIVFGMAKDMVIASPMLASRSESFKRSIIVPTTASSYKVLSSDAYTKHGLNAHGIIFDEVHAQPNRELWDVLTTSVGARRQPLTVAITTAGYDRQSLCYELYDHACKVRDGIVDDPHFLPVIYEAPADADWKSPKTWRKAHPGLGVSVKKQFLAEECEKAKNLPSFENTFRRLYLNQWTEQDTRWLSVEVWNANAGGTSSRQWEEVEGRECFAGLDLASTTDLAAFVMVFEVDGKLVLLPRFWMPQEGIRRRVARDRVPYDAWVRDGLIEATEGDVIDYDVIRARINELGERYHIREIAVDRWNSTQISSQLTADGFEMIGFGQGMASMSGPMKELERRLLAGEIVHGGNPVLAWMAANVAVEQDAAGNIKPSKAKSTGRIDGIVAAAMAIGRLSAAAIEVPITDVSQVLAFV